MHEVAHREFFEAVLGDGATTVFEQIQQHEQAHVDFVTEALGDAATEAPSFDFTAGGRPACGLPVPGGA